MLGEAGGGAEASDNTHSMCSSLIGPHPWIASGAGREDADWRRGAPAVDDGILLYVESRGPCSCRNSRPRTREWAEVQDNAKTRALFLLRLSLPPSSPHPCAD